MKFSIISLFLSSFLSVAASKLDLHFVFRKLTPRQRRRAREFHQHRSETAGGVLHRETITTRLTVLIIVIVIIGCSLSLVAQRTMRKTDELPFYSRCKLQ